MLQGILREDAIKKSFIASHTWNQILPLMGCIQHEVHTTLICTCRYAVLQVYLRHVRMCILTPRLEYKLPKGKTWSSSYYPPPLSQCLEYWSGKAKPLGTAIISVRSRDRNVLSLQYWKRVWRTLESSSVITRTEWLHVPKACPSGPLPIIL